MSNKKDIGYVALGEGGHITYRCYQCKERYCAVRIKVGEEMPTECPYLLVKCKWQKKGHEESYA